MVFCCFSKEPLQPNELGKGKYGTVYGDFADKPEKFQITLCQAPCQETGCYCASMFCLLCAQMKMRKQVLEHVNPGSGLSDYKCCQGFYRGCCCCQPGKCGEKTCPCPCLCLEVFFCPGPAASATSLVLRKQYNLGLDQDDVRLIRCNNCIYCTSIILSCLTICIQSEALDIGAHFARVISNCVFCCTASCMMGQAKREMDFRNGKVPAIEKPSQQAMER